MPLGRAPLSEKVGTGEPVAVTVNDPAVPTVKVALLALVMTGVVLITVSVCVLSVLGPKLLPPLYAAWMM
jgi:hypothetical protein